MAITTTRLVGFLNGGQWNKDTRKWEIGKFKAGENFGIKLSYGVSKKDKNSGERIYGQSIPVTLWLDNKEQFADVVKKIENMVVIEGYFTPSNYEKEGKEIKGNQFNCNYSGLFVETEYSGGGSKAPATSEISVDDLPF